MRSNNPALLKAQWQAGQPARDAEAQVRAVYGGPEKPLAKALMREAENYAHLLRQTIGDVVAKNIPGFVPESGDITFRKVFNPPKVQEAENKYPDLWTEFYLMNKRLSEYRPQNTHYGKMIYDSKTLQEADGHANALKQIHKSLYGNFQTELYNMKNQLDLKLKDVCQPSVIMPDNPEPIHPMGGIPHGNAQANQPDNEVERLMQELEQMRTRLTQQENENRQKDGIIAQQNTELRHKDDQLHHKDETIEQKNIQLRDVREQLHDSREANTDLREANGGLREQLRDVREENTDLRGQLRDSRGENADLITERTDLRGQVADLIQEVTQKNTQIGGLNQDLQDEHNRYDLLKTNFDILEEVHNLCIANNHPPDESSDLVHMSQMTGQMSSDENGQ